MTPSPGFSVTIRLRCPKTPGALGLIATAIGGEGGDIVAIDVVDIEPNWAIRDFTVDTASPSHTERIVTAIRVLNAVEVVHVSDRTFLLHLGGKIEVVSKTPLRTRADLSMAYTPGVARVCEAIHHDPERAFTLTIKKNTVAVVTDGTAVLGLGNIGPAAALPVMEGKAMLFREFADISAFPVCLDSTDTEQIVETVRTIAPVFGGINLEDIAAPRCFEIEERLREVLDIPVFHDDQHGTAVVVLAALINGLRVVGKDISKIKVVINGLGAAGVACTKILLAAGVVNLVGCDKMGAVYRGRTEGMSPVKHWYAAHTNPDSERGPLSQVLRSADVFIGVSAANVLRAGDVAIMAERPRVFALANPVPEIMPEDAAGLGAVIATGRSDYPNQINNVLCFPGMFRGALSCRAREINEEMKLAAANAIASVPHPDELGTDYIVPSVFNRRVVESVADAVEAAAIRSGVARTLLARAAMATG